jgi:precorrin-2 dehydrogenase / sirohydrochlorin ferrochelatase
MTRMAKYPINLEMRGRRSVVIGAGPVAARKVQSLQAAGARVTVIAEHIQPVIEEAFQLPHVELVLSPYQKAYLVGATLVIAATNDITLNRQIFTDCQELEILCNVVDQPDLCDFFVPAVVKRGNLQIAVSTDGHCPAYAGHIRKKLEQLFTDTHGHFLEALDQSRRRAVEIIDDPDQRKAVLGQLAGDESFDYFVNRGLSEWHEYAENLIADHTNRPL